MSKVLVLRTCNADGTSRNGFRWPESGYVECPDWNPEPICGHGLHGLLWGEGDGVLLNWSAEARWQVLEVEEGEIISFGTKVKFPRGKVLFTGNRLGATSFLQANGAAGKEIVGGTALAGDGGTARAGDGGILFIRWWEEKNKRYRIAIAYVGENGILPNTKYRLDESHNFVVVDSTLSTEAK